MKNYSAFQILHRNGDKNKLIVLKEYKFKANQMSNSTLGILKQKNTFFLLDRS